MWGTQPESTDKPDKKDSRTDIKVPKVIVHAVKEMNGKYGLTAGEIVTHSLLQWLDGGLELKPISPETINKIKEADNATNDEKQS